ncbi:MAG: chitobiase/beta-hexosaminidase C-terminal domain-containing protein, partial [Myxococcales bacterium]|nr:chitobiase/beta-hexosaminidase C-terminal domain-containing protein [Myxococcales bacterium]
CPADCGQCCGNGRCGAGENCATCPADCGQCCGNGRCGAGENCALCPADCACAGGQECDVQARECVDICVPACAGLTCGPDGCGGSCGRCGNGTNCEGGQCVMVCNPDCDGRACGDDGCGGVCGLCDDGQICSGQGQCLGGGPACDACADGEACLDGVCRAPEELCGGENPNGLCPNGQDCVAGACEDSGAGCSPQNPTGLCPVGQVCRDGGCAEFDGPGLCDDNNPCTADAFDFARNRCVHQPVAAQCTDGNGCTVNACVAGECTAQPIMGCVAPPTVEPIASPTNVGAQTLRGTKPAGSAIEINGEVAVPESPEANWQVPVNLVPGRNVYRIRSTDAGQASAETEVVVVYDITPPTLNPSPAGGVYLNGVTLTVAANEPGWVYFTTDGGTPDAWSDRFYSARTFRVFDTTRFRFRAQDLAGNWQAEITEAAFEITGENNHWSTRAQLPEPRTLAGITGEVAGNLWIAGGTDGQAPQAGAWRYNVRTDAWTDLPSLPVARSQLALARWSGRIYAFGGENDGIPLNLVRQLVDGQPAWADRRAMPSTRFGLQAVTVGDRIYVFGGKTNGGVVLETLEVYNPAADTWTNEVAQMPRARYGFAAVADGTDIYLLGGEDAAGAPIAAVDVYDTAGNRWRQVGDLPTPRAFLGAFYERNEGNITGGAASIITVGGKVLGGAASAVVEAYIIDEDRWVPRTPLPQARHSHATFSTRNTGGLDTEHREGWVVGGQVAQAAAGGTRLTDDMSAYEAAHDHTRRLLELPAGRFMHAAVAIGEQIYVVGGREFQETTVVWRFDPETGRYEDLAELPGAQNGLSAVSYGGKLYTFGGTNAFGLALPTVRSYDPVLDRWTDHAPMRNGRRDAVALVRGAEIWVIGGDNNGAVQAVEIYDPAANTWRNGPLLPQARAGAVGMQHDGQLVIFGGRDADGQIQGTLFTLNNGQWASRNAGIAVADAVGVLMHDHEAVIFGGRTAGGLTNRHWVYELNTNRVDFEWVASHRLLAPYDFAAAVKLNGEIYVLGGNASAEVGPNGERTVQKLAGRCFDGQQGTYEITNSGQTDLDGGCGAINIEVPLNSNKGYGHHGSCNSWNACGSAAGCANMACSYYNHGPALSFQSTTCTAWRRVGGRTCDIFSNANSLDQNFSGCDLPIATNVVCTRR